MRRPHIHVCFCKLCADIRMQDKIVFTGEKGEGKKDSVEFKRRKRFFEEVLMNIVHYTEFKMKICR